MARGGGIWKRGRCWLFRRLEEGLQEEGLQARIDTIRPLGRPKAQRRGVLRNRWSFGTSRWHLKGPHLPVDGLWVHRGSQKGARHFEALERLTEARLGVGSSACLGSLRQPALPHTARRIMHTRRARQCDERGGLTSRLWSPLPLIPGRENRQAPLDGKMSLWPT